MKQLISELTTPVMVGSELRTPTSLNMRAARALATLGQLTQMPQVVELVEPELQKEYNDAVSKDLTDNLT